MNGDTLAIVTTDQNLYCASLGSGNIIKYGEKVRSCILNVNGDRLIALTREDNNIELLDTKCVLKKKLKVDITSISSVD